MAIRIPAYMFEGVGQMANSNLVDVIEQRMLQNFSKKLDAQGITEAGVRVSPAALEGMGSLGGWKFGRGIRNLFSKISGKAKSKAAKAKKKAVAAAGEKVRAVKKLAQTPAAMTTDRKVLEKTAQVAAKIEKKAIQEAEAPKVTKSEIMAVARPEIRKAAEQAAKGAKAAIKDTVEKRGPKFGRGFFNRRGKSRRAMPTRASRTRPYGLIRRNVRMPFLPPLNDVPASSYEEMDVSGFGDIGADINSGADAFGMTDVATGADAFGMTDVATGADAFGLAADVDNGADAF